MARPTAERCANCRHSRAFHVDSGPCRARHCPKDCQKFVPEPSPADQPRPDAPPRDRLITAIDDITTAIEHAAGTPRAPEAAAALAALVRAVPILHNAAAAAPYNLVARLAACQQPQPAPEGAEVAPDARDTPGPTP